MALSSAVRTLLLGHAGPRRPALSAGPLRIAMGIETLGLGGAEMVVFQLSEELRRRGHSIIAIGPDDRDGWLKQTFLKAGIHFEGYRLRSPIDWGCAEHFAEILRAHRIDVLHDHEFVASVYGAAGARLAGVPHVLTMHGNQQMTQKFQRRVALRWAIRHSAHTVAVSGDTRTHLVQSLGVREDEIEIIRNGIPDRPGDGRSVRRELGLDEDDLLVLAVGSLMQRKGHRILLEAMTIVSRTAGLPRWKVAIAGEGVERPALESYIAEHGLADRAVLLGNRGDVPDLQAAADVFTMPSLWEGLPLAVLEAMFASNPVVATTASGIPEAITDGEHGLLVPGGDAPTLAHAIVRLLGDRALREQLGARARAEAQRRFSIRAMADAYERCYRG
jgi:glycosyltransferase involved in cell wall biosynthesis